MKMNAVILYNAFVCGSPSYSSESARKKTKQWRSFLDKIDWRKMIEKKEKKPPQDLSKIFRSVGVPVRKKKKENA